MSDAFKCDRCGKDSEGEQARFRFILFQIGGYSVSSRHVPVDDDVLCESCARAVSLFVKAPPLPDTQRVEGNVRDLDIDGSSLMIRRHD